MGPLPCHGAWQASSASGDEGRERCCLHSIRPLSYPVLMATSFHCGGQVAGFQVCECVLWRRRRVQYRQCMHALCLFVVSIDGHENSPPISFGLRLMVQRTSSTTSTSLLCLLLPHWSSNFMRSNLVVPSSTICKITSTSHECPCPHELV